MKWFWQVFSGQIRLKMAYPWGFWSSFLLELFVVTSINWFLWQAVIEARGGQAIEGFGLRVLVLYALITTVLRKVQLHSGQWGGIGEDIYTGALNKYLVYPVSYLGFRYAMHMGDSLLSLVQCSLALVLYWFLFALGEQSAPGITALFQCAVLIFCATTLRFFLNSCIQCLAFWFDQVWSLLVLSGFLIQILGGQMIPLALYPRWSLEILRLTPFPVFAGWPAEALLGRMSWPEFMHHLAVSMLWGLIFFGAFHLCFRRGSRNYSGVGA